MVRRRERANQDWETPKDNFSWDHVAIEVLMDIRNELRTLNSTLACYRVSRMSDDINRIDRRLQARGLKLQRKKKGTV